MQYSTASWAEFGCVSRRYSKHVGGPLARDEAARFPCLHTVAPLAATTKPAAVEILIVPLRSPPVLQVSTQSRGVATTGACANIDATKPVISSTLSPFVRSALHERRDLGFRRSVDPQGSR